ncbi:MAG: exo-alpha-sialidase [Opitutaceae bacterium]|nr:exo-alpha-sialidase [Opitutaceae bacterium]
MAAPPAAPRPNPSPVSRLQQPGPWDQDIVVYRVPEQGRATALATFERAGVATIARLRDGRLVVAHQHFPAHQPDDFDKVAVRFSSDDGKSWTAPVVIRLRGLPEGMRFPFDPTLVPLADGRVRLYFTSLRGRRFEEATPAIYSAVSSDAVEYTVEPGMRFGIDDRPVIDCAVVLHHGVFHLYSPDNGRGFPPGGRRNDSQSPADRPREGVAYHATSVDGLKFERADDVQIEGRRRWLGNAQSDGNTITFFGTGEGGIWTATSTDGFRWTLGRTWGGFAAADPGAIALEDRTLLVVGTSPPRPGTNSERRGRPPPPPRRAQP